MGRDVLVVEIEDRVAVLTMNRPERRNAMSAALLGALDAFFAAPPEGVRVVVLQGAGGHFCAGLDLSEHAERDAEATMRHSRAWHAVMDRIQFGGLPVVSSMAGAVIGGGLELAAATHVRIAEPDAVFQLPEGRRGIFVGGGATVRVARIIGADRMTEMMLTGRRYDAADALRLGLAHRAAGAGEGPAMARDLAREIAQNAPLSNYLMVQGVARIAEMPPEAGLLAESLCAGLAQTGPDAAEGLAAFLEKRAPRFR